MTAQDISRDLRAILALTSSAIAGDFDAEGARELLQVREPMIRRIVAAVTAGAVWGPRETELFEQMRALDAQAMTLLRAPHEDAFAWLARRDAERAGASSAR